MAGAINPSNHLCTAVSGVSSSVRKSAQLKERISGGVADRAAAWAVAKSSAVVAPFAAAHRTIIETLAIHIADRITRPITRTAEPLEHTAKNVSSASVTLP